MSSILVSAEPAEALNRRIREKIDPALFLTCNYAPTTGIAIHWDAKFYVGVQNLYKFAVDSTCVTPALYYFAPEAEKWRFSHFRDLVGVVKMLRAVLDHNNSQVNGFFEQNQLDEYRVWQQRELGKMQAETDQDFERLYRALEQLGEKLITQLTLFVDLVAESADKAAVVDHWKREILNWYCKKQDIYLGQLAVAYMANAAAAGANMNRITAYNIRPKLDRWIESALFADLDEKIRSCEYVIQVCPAAARQAEEKKEAYRQESEARREEIQRIFSRRQGNGRSTAADCRDYFFMKLCPQLQATMENCGCGMLPQELLQEDINRHFANVGAEDFSQEYGI